MTDQIDEQLKMSRAQIISLGVGLTIVAFILGYVLFVLWPNGVANAQGVVSDVEHVFLNFKFKLSSEVRLILLVMVVGLIGSYIQAVVSFVNFTGNRTIVKSWIWYYTLRPFIGAFLSLIFYYLLRGGMLSVNSSIQDINEYGLLAVAGMVGLCSKQALEKLFDVFKELFKKSEPDKDKDKNDSTSIQISDVIPDSPEKTTKFIILGKGFLKDSVVFINDVKRDTAYKNENVITVAAHAGDTAKTELKIFIKNPNGDLTSEHTLKIK